MDDIETVHAMELCARYHEAFDRFISGLDGDSSALYKCADAIYRLGYRDYFVGRHQMPDVFGADRHIQSLWDHGYRTAVAIDRKDYGYCGSAARGELNGPA